VSLNHVVALNNGVLIPRVGFGTYKIPAAETAETVQLAIEAGYQHIDTAQMYRNEREVGIGIAQSGVPRSEIFVTTKLNNAFHHHDTALAAFEKSLSELQLDYVDLFLIHWPLPALDNYVEAWQALESIYDSGRARAIGVSNFQKHHLEKLLAQAKVIPAVNQIEIHPYLTQNSLRVFNASHGIATEAWSPLGRGRVLSDPIIGQIATSHKVSAAQVILKWHLQRGDIVIPKSVHPLRIKQNLDLFGFELSETEMEMVSNLNRDERFGSHPDEENRIDR
jgi:2,5-diketo-D-gluconate reductase A